jgi:uncharacterized membrane protein
VMVLQLQDPRSLAIFPLTAAYLVTPSSESWEKTRPLTSAVPEVAVSVNIAYLIMTLRHRTDSDESSK